LLRSRDSAVGIATGYGLDDRGGLEYESREGRHSVQTGSEVNQPPTQWVPGAKRPGREADHSPPTSAEVKKMWIYNPLPIPLHGVVLNYEGCPQNKVLNEFSQWKTYLLALNNTFLESLDFPLFFDIIAVEINAFLHVVYIFFMPES
jgi:hypothetical protein